MAKTTIASLEARIIKLEALVTSLSAPKSQASAPKLAMKVNPQAPMVTYYMRGGKQYMKTRIGNRSVESLVAMDRSLTPTFDEYDASCAFDE